MHNEQIELQVSSIKQLPSSYFVGRVPFHTPLSPSTGEYGVHAFFTQCPHCGDIRYVVKSHSTVLYTDGCTCRDGAPFCDTVWYSKSTAYVQRLLAEAYTDYREALQETEVQEERKETSVAAYRKTRATNKARLHQWDR